MPHTKLTRSLVAFMIACLATAACNSNSATSPTTTTAVGTQAAGVSPAGTQITLGPAPEAAQQQVQAASPPAQAIITKTSGALGLKPDETACLAKRLDADTGLRDALGDNPSASPRYTDLATLAQDCIRVTSGAVNFANGIAAQAPGLSTETLACLRDGYAKLTAQDVQGIVQNGLTPGSVNTDAQNKLNQLLDGCKVDRSKLTPAGR